MADRKVIRVDAVLSEGVVALIEQLGLREKFEQGEYHCYVCNDIVTYANLKLLFPKGDSEVGGICDKPQCFVQFALGE